MLKPCDCDTISANDNGMFGVKGFALATMKKALSENGVIHIMIDKLSEYEHGALIALYKGECRILRKFMEWISLTYPKNPNKELSITELSRADCEEVSLIFKFLENMSANGLIRKEYWYQIISD